MIIPNGKYNKQIIPDKLYFKIGEVSTISGLPAYVLRFWETEFSKINPKRTSSGQRLYKKSDVELILEIKHLLYDKKFTIPGAKKHLNAKTREKKKRPLTEIVDEIRQELEEIRNLLG
ncbi:MAG: MerR family transcriptional regulator [Desulfobacterales bacterium]|nr:MerR family transcriptional regulator [Desulfobacterales bacterium]